METILWVFDNMDFEQKFIGPVNQTIELINTELNMKIIHVNNKLIVCEEDENKINKCLHLMEILNELHKQMIEFNQRDIVHILHSLEEHANYDALKADILKFYTHKTLILNTTSGKKIYAKSLSQKQYIELLESKSIVFCTGSAGTGKTYLAVAYAVNALKRNDIKKIIITRPAVEAGEKLGFLPGDLKEKVDPYLIPIYDALNDFLNKENVDKLIEKGVIEIAPLAYMRGRTLDHAIIILDEAQNTTSNQMKMFITRLGFNSKMIITGDISQIDLQKGVDSGLIEATKILKKIPGIGFLHFDKYDVMRHPLVSKIISCYEEKNI